MLSFVLARLHNLDPFPPRYDTIHLRQKLSFLRLYLCHLITESG